MGASRRLETEVVNPEPFDRDTSWWSAHKDFVLYPATGIVVGVLGLLWNGTLSMILTPIWMLAGVWWIPTAIERKLKKSRR